jgi:hypothetical protein
MHIDFKTKVVSRILGWIFYGIWYWYTWIKSKTIWRFKIFGWNFIQKMCFFAFLSNKCIIITFFKEKTTTISKKRFHKWALYYFFNFLLFGNVSWTTNMKPSGHWKIGSYILYVHQFIQFSSSNYWIKINFDSKWLWVLKCCHENF